MKKEKEQAVEIHVSEVVQGVMRFNVVGTSPILLNRMSEKAKRQLLLPPVKTKNRGTTLKHDPLLEFQDAPHRIHDDAAPTLLALPGAAFKRAMSSAALDIPGTNKSQIGRLVRVPEQYVPLYGVPRLFMTIVRSADIARTPDVRTMVIVEKWAATFDVYFVQPNLKEGAVANLLSAAGFIDGVGDGRNEKGKLSFGAFRLAADNDAEFNHIVANGDRAIQVEAMGNHEPYDADTAELLQWFDSEIRRREHRPSKQPEVTAQS